MSIAVATLTSVQQAAFNRRKDQLVASQRECLNKLMKKIADDGTHRRPPLRPDQIAKNIADFIKTKVLQGKTDFCQEYQEELEAPPEK